MNLKKKFLSAVLGAAICTSAFAIEANANSDKTVLPFNNFTISFLNEAKATAPIKKIKDSTKPGGEGAVVNLDRDKGSAWITSTIYAPYTSTKFAGGLLQRGQRAVFPYFRHATLGHAYELRMTKTHNTGNQGSAMNRTVTISGRWSPDTY
ncbi:hypothetical protein GCM10007425_06110 [Lysinibacillus alkalisoli]|uniref:Uncharacterized protein n=1 Tax=Lysinibacillus alkalisoli TaxID=1911548 RepID=A0A917FYU5_9BACI|nr:hypothetical protein [Lysinibacillus alkalisoli]GGG14599.1 hypothetical protein GCM10007425_06110 [Lysinibacillus alkalisoli]